MFFLFSRFRASRSCEWIFCSFFAVLRYAPSQNRLLRHANALISSKSFLEWPKLVTDSGGLALYLSTTLNIIVNIMGKLVLRLRFPSPHHNDRPAPPPARPRPMGGSPGA